VDPTFLGFDEYLLNCMANIEDGETEIIGNDLQQM
jgi:hypothetical protein